MNSPENQEVQNNKPQQRHQKLYQIKTYHKRRECRYWQQSGCLLDSLEKLCEGETSPESLIWGTENIKLCCCSLPYKPCRRKDADPLCLRTVEKHFPDNDTSQESIKEPEAVNNNKDSFLLKVQSIRTELIESHPVCTEMLASSEPPAKCSMSAQSKPFDRHDLICEMLTWQWEELGDGNAAEFEKMNCPFVENDKSINGDSRKGATGFIAEDNKDEGQKVEL